MAHTIEMTDAEYMDYQKKVQSDPMAAYREEGLYQLTPEETNEKYDLASFLMVWITDTQRHHIKYEVKHSGWVQEVINFEPRRGRPPAGNGMYWNSFLDVVDFKKGSQYVKWLDHITKYAADNLGKEAKEQTLCSRLLTWIKAVHKPSKPRTKKGAATKVA